jgi:inorganic triphosphatase YgiF
LDPKAAEKTALEPLLADETTGARIQPIVTVRTKRHAFLVERHNSAVELVLDRTTVTANGRSARFMEIELELKSGDVRALFLTAKDVSRAAPARLSLLAKSERGYRLLEDAPPKPVKSGDVTIAADTPSLDAFQIAARELLSRIVQNEELLRSAGDPEALHQMRVGIRRLRTAMSLFRKLLRGRQTRAIMRKLRRYGRVLGPARDLDVLHRRLGENGPTAGSQSDLDTVEAQRSCAYATLRRKLDKPRFRKALLQTAIWIEAGTWLSDSSKIALRARSKPAEKVARKALARLWSRICRDAKRIDTLSTEDRHSLRVRIKEVRYASEFFVFNSHASSRRRKSQLKWLEKLQDVLGEMNDIAVRQRILPSAAESRPDEVAALINTLMTDAKAAAGRLRSTKPFWE